jgi:hypothetical protein
VDEEYVMSQHVEINNIADQLLWENENEEDVDAEEGPQIGVGMWVNNVWLDPIDSHPVPQRQKDGP